MPSLSLSGSRLFRDAVTIHVGPEPERILKFLFRGQAVVILVEIGERWIPGSSRVNTARCPHTESDVVEVGSSVDVACDFSRYQARVRS